MLSEPNVSRLNALAQPPRPRAGGGIGQPLSMLLKMNKMVTELALYDIAGTPGVAADLSHCNTPVAVSAHMGEEELGACLKGCDLVVIPAGVPRKPGMTRDDLFNTNAGALRHPSSSGSPCYAPRSLARPRADRWCLSWQNSSFAHV